MFKALYLKVFIFLACFCMACGQASSQSQPTHTWKNGILELKSAKGILRIQPLTSKIIEVSWLASEVPIVDSSHAVILKNQKPKVSFKDKIVSLETNDAVITIHKTNGFELSFSNKQKDKLLTQVGESFEHDTLKGFQFRITPEEALYGAGARALPLNRRGKRLLLYNNPHYGYEDYAEVLNYSIPVVMSSQNYMLLFDNATKGYMDLGATEKDKLSFEALKSGKQTYYFIIGANMCDMLESYTLLTGRQQMPPQWAMGNFASRYGYHTEEETRSVIQEFEKQDIPVSAVILDHYWYGEGEVKKNVAMGDLDWYKPKFPDGAKMVQDFRKKGIETVLISQPFVLTNSKNFKEAREKRILALSQFQKTYIIDDFWFGQTAILDIFKPQTQAWYWNQYKRLINEGAVGIWGDLGEPEKHPDGIFHLDGKLKAQEAHNIYGHYWAKTVHEGFKRDFPMLRPFILMRAGFAGSQRFSLIPWSGDVAHSWKGFRGQPALAMSMGLCGVGYMHADAGGFAGGEKDDELYIRWLQYSLFQPIFRPHCQEKIPSEPVFYEEPTKSIVREIVKWRYRLLPYNQTLAYENSKTGKPLMRPLFLAEPQNKELHNIADTYLWGRDLLVAPIFEQGASSRKLYLTKGDSWYDFFTGERHEGGKWIEAKLDRQNMGYFPVYVRAGASLLTMPEDRLAQKYATDKLNIIHYIATAESKEAEVESNFYLEKTAESGAVIEAGFIKIEADKVGKIELEAMIPKDLQNPKNNFLKKDRSISLTIKGLNKIPTSITLNRKALSAIQIKEATRTEKTIQLNFEWRAGKEIEIAWK